MAEITVKMIQELRNRTGVGMSKCKEALHDANGDMDLAIANLRKAGMATAVKKEGRETKEAMIGVAETDNNVALVEIAAETDFVLKNDRFQDFLKDIAEEVVNTLPESLETFLTQKYSKEPNLMVEEYRTTIVQAIGENIQIKRLAVFPKDSTMSMGIYQHLGGRMVTIVNLKGSNDQQTLARDIAMHCAAAAPEYVSPTEIPAEIIEQEKDIVKGQIKNKPENIIEKIVEGKIKAFYDQVCLLHQHYIKDDKLTIEALVAQKTKETGNPLEVDSFVRWYVGQQ